MPGPLSGPESKILELGLWFLPWTQSQTTDPGTWALEQNLDPKPCHSPKAETQTVDVIYQMPESDIGCQTMHASLHITYPGARAGPLPRDMDPRTEARNVVLRVTVMFPAPFI